MFNKLHTATAFVLAYGVLIGAKDTPDNGLRGAALEDSLVRIEPSSDANGIENDAANPQRNLQNNRWVQRNVNFDQVTLDKTGLHVYGIRDGKWETFRNKGLANPYSSYEKLPNSEGIQMQSISMAGNFDAAWGADTHCNVYRYKNIAEAGWVQDHGSRLEQIAVNNDESAMYGIMSGHVYERYDYNKNEGATFRKMSSTYYNFYYIAVSGDGKTIWARTNNNMVYQRVNFNWSVVQSAPKLKQFSINHDGTIIYGVDDYDTVHTCVRGSWGTDNSQSLKYVAINGEATIAFGVDYDQNVFTNQNIGVGGGWELYFNSTKESSTA